MLRATLRSLLARKLRLALSGLTVVLGVSFVSGTLILTDTLGRVFDDLFATVNAGTSVSVRGVNALGEGATADREPVPEDTLARIRSVAGVAEAVGRVLGYAQVVGPDGKAVSTGGAPSLGVEINPDSRQEALVLKSGEAPQGEGEVAIDAATADKVGIELGDRVTVLLRGPAREFTVSGIVGFGTTDNLAGASLTAFELPVAQRLVGVPGTFAEIAVAAKEGVDGAELGRRISTVLPDGYEAVPAGQIVAEASAEVKQGLGFFSTALLVFAAISLFVGAFLIFNTFSMLVAQRTRELALLRALGASRRQVTTSVLIEALVVGLLASVAGFVLGPRRRGGTARPARSPGHRPAVGPDRRGRPHGHRQPGDRGRRHLHGCPGAGQARRPGRPGRGAAGVRSGSGPVAGAAGHRRCAAAGRRGRRPRVRPERR